MSSIIDAERLSDAFVDVADTLVAEFDLVDFLHNLTEHVTAVSAAAAVGLMLGDRNNNLCYMAASTEQGKFLELIQLQADEGPCLDCYQSGAPVTNSDLANADTRWPTFAPQARAAGFQSVHAFPLRLRDQAIGAMSIFGTDDHRFAAEEVRVVQALADVATIGILQERAIERAETLAEQLQGALNSRIIVEQAKGAISKLRGVSVDEAYLLLRSYARKNNARLSAVAEAVVTQPDRVAELARAQG